MLIDTKFFTLLAFIVINFLILFAVKTRTTTIISLIIAHLVAVLFFSLSISNYNSFKEIVLALIIYSMVILFLISNYVAIFSVDEVASKIKARWQKYFSYFAVFSIVMIAFLVIFFIAKDISKVSDLIRDKKIAKQSEAVENPMVLPSHAVHIAVKSFYLGKNFQKDWSDKTYEKLEINERKKARLKDKLSDNFLLKRSSDVILIIVAATTVMLLLRRKKIDSEVEL
jgi:hypothetical protein